ncbi:deleted in azoospermia-like [Alexandromys fortis]|uniref:deleted in azoospermia-like n=1 Tax=Alexandromys fortis TaxID=100897 RepID=UPI0021532320|nr:deleted in azoospermia-like [Microtus fortis]
MPRGTPHAPGGRRGGGARRGRPLAEAHLTAKSRTATPAPARHTSLPQRPGPARFGAPSSSSPARWRPGGPAARPQPPGGGPADFAAYQHTGAAGTWPEAGGHGCRGPRVLRPGPRAQPAPRATSLSRLPASGPAGARPPLRGPSPPPPGTYPHPPPYPHPAPIHTPTRPRPSATTSESPNSAVSREASTQSSSAATSQGYVLPEGKIMPNTVFVGGIDVRMDEAEIRSFFARYGSVKEVKIITDRTGVSKGYGFVSFYNDVDVQKIVESQINFHGKKLKLGPAIRKQNLCTYHVQPRPLIFNPPPPPQFQSVWSSPNAETYMQPPTMMNPITQYVQAYPPYPSSPVQVITGYQLPVYNYQMPPQWPAGEQRSYVIPPAYTTVNYHCSEVDSGTEVVSNECSVHEASPASGNGSQKKSVDRSIQTVVSCLFNPENRLRNSLVTQDDYFKDKRVHHFRRSRAVLKSDHLC